MRLARYRAGGARSGAPSALAVGGLAGVKPLPPVDNPDPPAPEWLIHEDNALLQVRMIIPCP